MTRTVTMWHATNRKNIPSIRVCGLLTSHAQAERKLVWLHQKSIRPWAVLHVAKRHGWKAEDVVLVKVAVRRDSLTRFKGAVYTSQADVAPESVCGFEEW